MLVWDYYIFFYIVHTCEFVSSMVLSHSVNMRSVVGVRRHLILNSKQSKNLGQPDGKDKSQIILEVIESESESEEQSNANGEPKTQSTKQIQPRKKKSSLAYPLNKHFPSAQPFFWKKRPKSTQSRPKSTQSRNDILEISENIPQAPMNVVSPIAK